MSSIGSHPDIAKATSVDVAISEACFENGLEHFVTDISKILDSTEYSIG